MVDHSRTRSTKFTQSSVGGGSEPMIEMTNADLLARLRTDEDHFTERKTFRDKDGWLRTAVAFANSAPVGWPAILFVGVTSKGLVEHPAPNLDELQKKRLLSKKCN